MYPLLKLTESDLYLKNFFWLEDQRPKNVKDLFLIFPKKTRVKPAIEALKKGGAGDKAVPAVSSPGVRRAEKKFEK